MNVGQLLCTSSDAVRCTLCTGPKESLETSGAEVAAGAAVQSNERQRDALAIMATKKSSAPRKQSTLIKLSKYEKWHHTTASPRLHVKRADS